MLQFDAQCCDAHQYINLARTCLAGECYDPLRPAGIQYWFSLPLRFELPLEYLIVANWVLLLISILLATMAMRTVLRQMNFKVGLGITLLTLPVLAGAQLFFFWPFMSVLLADAPAGLMAMIGLWALLIGAGTRGVRAALWLLLAGAGLGMSVWMRSFYLYPVLIMLVAHVSFWLFNRKRRAVDLLLLIALVPILIQFNMTWERYQQWSFIAPADSERWKGIHLSDSGIGYDTLLPFHAYRIFPSCKFIPGGMQAAWDKKSLSTLWCYTSRRIAYYWGSDTRSAYVEMKSNHNLFPYGERLDTLPIWSADGVRVTPDIALAPDGKQTAEKLSFPKAIEKTRDGRKRMRIGFMPTVIGPHTASIWLWSPFKKTLVMQWVNADSKAILTEKVIELTPTPTRYQLSADFPMEYFLLDFVTDADYPHQIGTVDTDYLYGWGLQLERGAEMTAYSYDDDPAQYRRWSAALFAANVSALVLALLLLYPIVQQRHIPLLLTLGFVGLTFGEGLLILPEQRFMVATNSVMWMLAALSFAITLSRVLQKRASKRTSLL